MAFDKILAGGTVYDGTGAAPRRADVALTGERIAAIGDLSGAEAGERIDATGLAVSPGFIDVHTHYDPQILWDSELTPTSWFGVTSVVMGNCGFTMAPLPARHRETLIQTLGNTEAMPLETLRAGIAWEFESFAGYLDAVARRRPALNVAAFVGHTTMRLAACKDPNAVADADDLRALRKELDLAMQAGAWGFSTSRSPAHIGAGGMPVPSRVAAREEFTAFAEVLRGAGAGMIQGVRGPGLVISDFADLARLSGRAATWTSLHQGVDGGKHWQYLAETRAERANGANLWAQMSCVPVTAHFQLSSPYVLNAVPALGELMGLDHAQRKARLADPVWQATALEQFGANRENRSFAVRLDRISVAESPAHPELEGRRITDIAGAAADSLVAMKCFIDIALADDLATRFSMIMFNFDDDEHGKLLAEFDGSIFGLGDGGAHTTQICDSAFCLHVLGHFARARGQFTIEQAIWRLTGQLADVFGIAERGVLKEGNYADICVFNAATVDEAPLRRVRDQPANAERLVADPIGIEHVLVNGKFVRRGGVAVTGTGAGHMLRPS